MRIWSGSCSWSTWGLLLPWRTSPSSSAPPLSSRRCPAGLCAFCCLLSAPRPCPSSALRTPAPPTYRPQGKDPLPRRGSGSQVGIRESVGWSQRCEGPLAEQSPPTPPAPATRSLSEHLKISLKTLYCYWPEVLGFG